MPELRLIKRTDRKNKGPFRRKGRSHTLQEPSEPGRKALAFDDHYIQSAVSGF